MRALVDGERARDGECLAASREVAHIWLCRAGRQLLECSKCEQIQTFLGVAPHVLLQRGGFREILLTFLALEGSVARMALPSRQHQKWRVEARYADLYVSTYFLFAGEALPIMAIAAFPMAVVVGLA